MIGTGCGWKLVREDIAVAQQQRRAERRLKAVDGVAGAWWAWRVPTLGFVAIDWIESNCVVPDGVRAGQSFVLTDEQYRFVLQHYRLRPESMPDESRPSAAFAYRRSLLVRPQKWEGAADGGR